MDNNKTEKFNKIIDSKIEELTEKINTDDPERDPVSPDVSIGRLSRMDSMQMQQMSLNTLRRQKAELKQLEDAKKRIVIGTFGKCAVCRKDISEERLEFKPDAELCINCAV